MEQQKFDDLIKKHFKFLFEDYGFSIVYSEQHTDQYNTRVVLQSGECKIKMYIDRGWFAIEGGLKGADVKFSRDWLSPTSIKRWYDLSFVLPFLTQSSNQTKFEYIQPPDGPGYNEEKNVESEMFRISTIIRPHIGEIIAFFQEDTFRKRQKELNEFIRKRAEEKGVLSKDVK
jgi:hypothetical protein